ncbi:hypothetical protein ACLQ25_16760 [Micromonospora sp. DT44]|uniref:hypothetical protein n=1 Tax=Micromonospora sp. DT44 TaxID=3393439 RepID=UPI003CE6E3BC
MAVVGDGSKNHSEHQAARRADRRPAQTTAAARTAAAHLPADDAATSQPGYEPASRDRETSAAEPPPATEPRSAAVAGPQQSRDVAQRSGPDAEAGPPEAEVASGRWSVGARLLLTAAAVVLVLGVMAVAVIVSDPYRLGQTYSDTGPQDTRQDAAAASDQTMTAPLAGRQKATFVLVDGLTSFDLRVTDLGDDLYRISSPSGTGVAARPVLDGETVRLGVVAAGASDGRAVRVLLSERVAWRLRLEGGVSEQVLDLTRARLLGVDLVGGSARTDLILPPVDRGVMTVRLTGGTSRLSVRVPGTPPVRVRAGAGGRGRRLGGGPRPAVERGRRRRSGEHAGMGPLTQPDLPGPGRGRQRGDGDRGAVMRTEAR